jgi:hypothetical protein
VKYEGCIDCEFSPGWRPVLNKRNAVERCECFQRHLERVAAEQPQPRERERQVGRRGGTE